MARLRAGGEMKKVKEGKFMDKIVERRRQAHPHRPCECWECLREIGLTPPLKMRDKFKCQFPKPWHAVRGHGVDIPGRIDHNKLVAGKKEVTESIPVEDRLEAVRV